MPGGVAQRIGPRLARQEPEQQRQRHQQLGRPERPLTKTVGHPAQRQHEVAGAPAPDLVAGLPLAAAPPPDVIVEGSRVPEHVRAAGSHRRRPAPATHGAASSALSGPCPADQPPAAHLLPPTAARRTAQRTTPSACWRRPGRNRASRAAAPSARDLSPTAARPPG